MTTTVTVISGCTEQVSEYRPGTVHFPVVYESLVSTSLRVVTGMFFWGGLSRPPVPGPMMCTQREGSR